MQVVIKVFEAGARKKKKNTNSTHRKVIVITHLKMLTSDFQFFYLFYFSSFCVFDCFSLFLFLMRRFDPLSWMGSTLNIPIGKIDGRLAKAGGQFDGLVYSLSLHLLKTVCSMLRTN